MNQERQRLFRQIQFDFMLCESSIVPQSSKSVTFFYSPKYLLHQHVFGVMARCITRMSESKRNAE